VVFSGNRCLIRVCGAAIALVAASIQGQAQPQILEELESISQPTSQITALAVAAEQAFSENRFHDAIKLYSGVIKLSPHNSSCFLGRGMAYEMANQPEKASDDYRKALEIDPLDFYAMENLAGIYEHTLERMPEAVLLYKRALELDSRPARQAELAFCLAVLERRLRPEDNSAVGCWNLGNKQAQKGNTEGAVLYYSKAIELAPRMFQAYHSRGLLRLRMGDLPMAIEDLSKAIQLSPSLRGCLVARGMAHEMNGDEEKAKADFERAVREDQRDPNAHYHLGRMLEKEQNYTHALQSYIEATRLRAKPDLRTLLQQRIAAVLGTGKVDLRSVTTPPKKGKELW
jgi:Flp pilus assembly protein TadD